MAVERIMVRGKKRMMAVACSMESFGEKIDKGVMIIPHTLSNPVGMINKRQIIRNIKTKLNIITSKSEVNRNPLFHGNVDRCL